jgi:Tc toxin complex TcA C-terminal TcB-binding domain
VRVSPALADGGYARDTDDGDDRFVDYLGSADALVTSGANNDSGMFETNLRDERFLPFEGAGAVSTWGLSLPSALRAFDYMTISDVILHVRYTARNGGAALGAQATKELQEALADASQAGLALLFSLRYDFPTEWSAFVRGTSDLSFTLEKSFFPYIAQGGPVTVDNLVVLGQAVGALVQATVRVPDGLADGLNGASGAAAVTVPADGQVLVRDAGAQVFLVVQYHLGS